MRPAAWRARRLSRLPGTAFAIRVSSSIAFFDSASCPSRACAIAVSARPLTIARIKSLFGLADAT
jgi:hypothetical protein